MLISGFQSYGQITHQTICVCSFGEGCQFLFWRLFIPGVLSAVAAGWQGAKGCREKFISRCYRLGGTTGAGGVGLGGDGSMGTLFPSVPEQDPKPRCSEVTKERDCAWTPEPVQVIGILHAGEGGGAGSNPDMIRL